MYVKQTLIVNGQTMTDEATEIRSAAQVLDCVAHHASKLVALSAQNDIVTAMLGLPSVRTEVFDGGLKVFDYLVTPENCQDTMAGAPHGEIDGIDDLLALVNAGRIKGGFLVSIDSCHTGRTTIVDRFSAVVSVPDMRTAREAWQGAIEAVMEAWESQETTAATFTVLDVSDLSLVYDETAESLDDCEMLRQMVG